MKKQFYYFGMAAALGLGLSMSSCSDDDTLSPEEMAQIIKENSLSAEDVQKMIAEQTLTAEQIAELIKANGITEEEIQAAIEAAKAYTDTTYHEVAIEDIPDYLYTWQYGKVAYIKPTGVTEDNIEQLFCYFDGSSVKGFLDLTDCKVETISFSIAGDISKRYVPVSADYQIAGIIFPKTLKSLMDRFAYGNTVLTSVTFYGNLEILSNESFAYCENLKSVTLAEGLEKIEGETFINTAIESIEIPASVTYVSYNMFGGCSSLKEVTFLATSLPEDMEVENSMLDGTDGVTIQVKCDAMGEYLKGVNSNWTVKNGDKEYVSQNESGDEGAGK